MPKQFTRRESAHSVGSITYWRKFAKNRVFYGILAALIGIPMIISFGMMGNGPGGGNAGRGAGEGGGNDAIAIVNGEPVQRAAFENQWRSMGSRLGAMPAGSQAGYQGMILDNLIRSAVARSVAKKQGITVSDEDVEKEIRRTKESLGEPGKPASDEDFEKFLTAQGGTMDQLREELKTGLLPQVLSEKIANAQKVSENDLVESYDEIKVRHILFPVLDTTARMPGALPDDQAKNRAEQVLVKIKGGADFAKMADEYSKDPANEKPTSDPKTKKTVTKKMGGDISADFPEGWYKRGGRSKEFDDAAFALAKGQVSGVVKTPSGYEIIKVEDKRRNLPQDFAKNKTELLQNLKRQRAQEPLQKMMEEATKTAKIEWKDPYFKWRYDLSKMGNSMMGMMSPPDPKAEATFLTELQAYAAKHPDDAAASLVLAQKLHQKFRTAGFQPGVKNPVPMSEAERTKLRDEAITYYEQALKKTEDRDARLTLAQLYRDTKQNDKALVHYKSLMRQLSYDDNVQDKFLHQQLVDAFTALGEKELADKEREKVQILAVKEEKERLERAAQEAKEKEQAAKDKADAAKKTGAANGGTINVQSGATVTIPGGGKATTGTTSGPTTQPSAATPAGPGGKR